jgi:hypothetical protein
MKIRDRMHTEFEASPRLVGDDLEKMEPEYLSSATKLTRNSLNIPSSSSASGHVFELPDTSSSASVRTFELPDTSPSASVRIFELPDNSYTPVTPAREELERLRLGNRPILPSSISGFPSELADSSTPNPIN